MKRFLEWGLIAVIAWSVLNFGGVQPLGYSVMEVSIFVLFYTLIVSQTRQGKIDVPLPAVFVLLLALVLLQTVPLPPNVVNWCSPSRMVSTALTDQAMTRYSWISLSFYVHDTQLGLAALIAYGGAFTLAAYVFDSRRVTSRQIQALISLAFFEAVYGGFQYLTGYQKIFTYQKQYYVEDATGTYINHNHFAGFLELVLPLLVAQLFYLISRRSAAKTLQDRHQLSWHEASSTSQVIFFSFVAVVILIGAFYSRSRMGIFSIFVSLALVGLLGQLKDKRRTWALLTLVILGTAFTYSLWIGTDPVFRRFEMLEHGSAVERSDDRLALWKSVIPLIKQNPVFGTGLGTFEVAYRPFQNVIPDFVIQHAHNDYIEFTSDLGIPGALLLFLPILYLFGKLLRAFLIERNRYRQSVLLGCWGSILATLIHSTADFNLQIPANALTFSVILGISYKLAVVEPRTESRRVPDDFQRKQVVVTEEQESRVTSIR